jgi:hypothetical protein
VSAARQRPLLAGRQLDSGEDALAHAEGVALVRAYVESLPTGDTSGR